MNWSNIEFAYPLWLLILPLPLIIYWLLPSYKTIQPALKVPFFNRLIKALGEIPTKGAHQLQRAFWQQSTRWIAWIIIVLALAKPMVLGPPQLRQEFGRDVMVAVDLSGSMAEQDFTAQDGSKITRLDAVKQVLADFSAQRKGDRLGLILFGDAAFIQTPFTADQQAWLTLLQQTEVAMAGQSTHLGDAIGLAIKVFSQTQDAAAQQREQVVIVLTDGNDTGSFVQPMDAAKVAASKGVRIHVIAMGDPATVGEQALDMDTIKAIAQLSGGQAFQALNRADLAAASEAINKLEPQLYNSTSYRNKQSLHAYLLMLLVVMHLISFALASVVSSQRREKSLSTRSVEEQGESHV